jgi:hypothetical protein
MPYARSRQTLEMFARRSPCLRFRRLTSARDLDAFEEVVRRLREGMVMVEAEYERPYAS